MNEKQFIVEETRQTARNILDLKQMQDLQMMGYHFTAIKLTKNKV